MVGSSKLDVSGGSWKATLCTSPLETDNIECAFSSSKCCKTIEYANKVANNNVAEIIINGGNYNEYSINVDGIDRTFEGKEINQVFISCSFNPLNPLPLFYTTQNTQSISFNIKLSKLTLVQNSIIYNEPSLISFESSDGTLIVTDVRFRFVLEGISNILDYKISSLIKISGGQYTFRNCIFNNSVATVEGGGVFNAGINNMNFLKIENCTFRNCTMHKSKPSSPPTSGVDETLLGAYGGAIYVSVGSGGLCVILIFIVHFLLYFIIFFI
jgi:hypothetical protein